VLQTDDVFGGVGCIKHCHVVLYHQGNAACIHNFSDCAQLSDGYYLLREFSHFLLLDWETCVAIHVFFQALSFG
jgi:hypothetical protein